MFVFISKIAAFLTFLAAFNGVIAQNATWFIDQELRLQFFNSGKTTPITHHKVNNILTGGDFFIYTSPSKILFGFGKTQRIFCTVLPPAK